MSKTIWMGQKILFLTTLFGKKYFWMEDGDGTIYLVKAKENINGHSFDASTGETVPVVDGYIPDFS